MSIEFTDKEKYFSQEEINPSSNSTDKNYPNSDIQQPTALDTFIVNTEAGTINMSQGSMQSPNFSTGNAGWKIDSEGSVEFGSGFFRGDITGSTGTFSGTITGGSLNIPDTTTASSFHVDSSGNTWWGANIATGISGATASVTNAGLATFKNVLVGGSTLQYQATDNGVFSFGDGSDGAYTFSNQGTAPSGTTKTDNTNNATIFRLDRDIYTSTLTVDATVTVKTNGYRIFAKTSLTVNGTIERNGNAGTAGVATDGTNNSHAGGTGGAALADGYLKGTDAGGNGGASGVNNGGSTGNKINSIGVQGSSGGNGLTGGSTGSGTGGTAGTITASNVKLIANWHLATLLDISTSGSTVKFDGSTSSGGGGGGGTNSGAITGGGGGGGGSAGGILAIYAKIISVSATGSITANGGAGGNGGNGSAGVGAGHGGGGGGGGAGGVVILVYNVMANSGTISANGGAKGTGGTSGDGNASDGTVGASGFVKQFQLSQ